jgi:serine/threonine-protein kinase RsbW
MEHYPLGMKAPARIEFLRPLIDFVESCAKSRGAGETRLREIDLAMEELLVNIFNYAYPGRSGDVEILCRIDDAGRLLVDIADEGIPFNMLSRQDPDLEAGIEERDIGGLGVFFVKQLVQGIQYRRESGRNILTLTIDPAPPLP